MADGESKAIIRAGGGVNAIIPQSFDEAWRIAGALASAGMTPKDINTQEKVLAVIMAGAEIGLAPFQAVQSFAIINGRPALWGDGMLGVVRKFGVRVEETLTGEGDTLKATCKVTRPDTGEVIERSFTAAEAKAAGLWTKPGPWTQYKPRMMQMRARAFALRDGCADMLRGMKMAEEVQDYTVESSEPLALDAPPPIKGAEKDALVEDWNARMRACTTPEDIDAVIAEAAEKRGRLSSNTWDGLEHVAAQEHERVTAGEAPREIEPSPFEDLKQEGLNCLEQPGKARAKAALDGWLAKAKSKTKLALCTLDERGQLKTLEKSLKAEIEARVDG